MFEQNLVTPCIIWLRQVRKNIFNVLDSKIVEVFSCSKIDHKKKHAEIGWLPIQQHKRIFSKRSFSKYSKFRRDFRISNSWLWTISTDVKKNNFGTKIFNLCFLCFEYFKGCKLYNISKKYFSKTKLWLVWDFDK